MEILNGGKSLPEPEPFKKVVRHCIGVLSMFTGNQINGLGFSLTIYSTYSGFEMFLLYKTKGSNTLDIRAAAFGHQLV